MEMMQNGSLKEIDNFYFQKEEPARGCLLALRTIIMGLSPEITAEWKYGMPFFCISGKMFCYLWTQKKTHKPYLGLVEGRNMSHPELIAEKRSRMKIFLLDPEMDLPIETIQSLLKEAIKLTQKAASLRSKNRVK